MARSAEGDARKADARRFASEELTLAITFVVQTFLWFGISLAAQLLWAAMGKSLET
jgi:hypothetical protein